MTLRPTGIDLVGSVPWGTHFCQFYTTEQDMLEVLVPYFKAGLEANEGCVWITSPPLSVASARSALGAAVPDLPRYEREGRLLLLGYDGWYVRNGRFEMACVLEGWLEQLRSARAHGFEGLRVSGNTSWLEPTEWQAFSAYEAEVERVVGRQTMLALCTYPIEHCSALDMADVMRTHQFALLKRNDRWELFEGADRRRFNERTARDLERGLKRFELLAETARELLQAREPERAANSLCARVMSHLDCQVFFNYLADDHTGRLHLNAWSGIGSDDARAIEWLDFGAAICGYVALNRSRVVAEDIQNTSEPRADLVRSRGVRAYACHPLLGPGGCILGTLSFGTTTRDTFEQDELSLMKAVTDQVAIAIVRQRDEASVRKSEEALREADRRKTEFLAVLSHELRNPLAPISNSLHVLEHVPPGGDQARRAQIVLRRQVNQLTRLVDDLLDATRIAHNKVSLQRQTLELNQLVRNAAEDQRALFEEAQCALELELCRLALHVDADPIRLAQIVSNLLQNAARFSKPGGRTKVAVVDEMDGGAAIRIVDDGLGIAAEMLPFLFTPFMQADNSLDRRKGGLGLGLSLVKGLVDLHGGTIDVSSAGLGAGTAFTVRLPLSQVDVYPEVLLPDVSSGATPRRVLVIEDNEDAADTLREALEFGRNEVAVAYSGLDGIRRAREFHPDVVLCDIGLPGMTGYDVARAFRSERELSGARLVALTGYALPEDRQRALEAGFDHHLPKPPSVHTIQRLLNDLR